MVLALALLVPAARVEAAVSTTDAGGAAIVFARLQGNPEDYELWKMHADGTHQQRLTWNGVADHDPTWSPDGTKIVWVRFETEFNVGPSDLWMMNADGTGRHRVTYDRADIRRPSWSPDGSQIAFTRDYTIHIVNADGTGEHNISPPGAFDFDPAWSPDGNSIAFASNGTRSFDLFSMSPDGSRRHRLDHTGAIQDERPAWSPDGQEIAFSGDHSVSSWHVYVINRDGSSLRQLVKAYSLDPAWSADGSRLGFYACVSDCGLYQIRSDGTGRRPLGAIRGYSDIQPDFR